MIKAVLFDMDGVLVDAKEWHYQAFNEALKLFGLQIDHNEHLMYYDGLPTRDKLILLTNKRGLPQELHQFLNSIKQDFTFDICIQNCHPIFSVQYAVSRLKRDGYKIAVCSNSIRKTIELMMEKSGLSEYIDLIVSNQDVKRGKPAPDMYLKAMKVFNIDAKEALICEDNDNGIRAALSSGGYLLKIGTVSDTNYDNIMREIRSINSKG